MYALSLCMIASSFSSMMFREIHANVDAVIRDSFIKNFCGFSQIIFFIVRKGFLSILMFRQSNFIMKRELPLLFASQIFLSVSFGIFFGYNYEHALLNLEKKISKIYLDEFSKECVKSYFEKCLYLVNDFSADLNFFDFYSKEKNYE